MNRFSSLSCSRRLRRSTTAELARFSKMFAGRSFFFFSILSMIINHLASTCSYCFRNRCSSSYFSCFSILIRSSSSLERYSWRRLSIPSRSARIFSIAWLISCVDLYLVCRYGGRLITAFYFGLILIGLYRFLPLVGFPSGTLSFLPCSCD